MDNTKTGLTQQALKAIHVISEYSTKIAAEPDRLKLIHLINAMGRDAVEAERCSLWLIDAGENELYTTLADGVEEIRIPADAGIVGYSIAKDITIISNDAYADSRFYRETDIKTGYTTRNIIAIPLKNSAMEIIGAFEVINKKDGQFVESDVKLLSVLTSLASKILENFSTTNILETILMFAARIACETNIYNLSACRHGEETLYRLTAAPYGL